MNAFERLHPALQHHIVNSLGWRELRPFQEAVIPDVLDGKHMIVLAPTAGGKTEAAFFPIASRMLTDGWQGLSVLYICPIKALLNNLNVRLSSYCELLGRRAALWHGDVRTPARKAILKDPPDLLLTTPESLEVMLVSPNINQQSLFRNLQVIVIDEIHAFAGDDRGWHLLSVLERISRIAGREVQRLGLSATVGNPETLVDWLAGSCTGTRDVFLPASSGSAAADVQLDFVGSLQNAAVVISRLHRGEKRLVFVDSRARAEQLSAALRQLEVTTYVTHSSLSKEQRTQAEEAFAQRDDCVIVATSVLELGIDVGNLDRVIQIDSPTTVASFLQRMGRTGRRVGTVRNCLFLATRDDALVQAAALIRLWESGYVEPIEPPLQPYHVLAQQLMGLVLQENGIGQTEWFDWLKQMPGFRDLPAADIQTLVTTMLDRQLLWQDAGILGLGREAEETWGRRNFMDLLSVFVSAPLFSVLHGRQEIGSVDNMTFMNKQDGPRILLLGGRPWKVNHIDWKRRKAYVEPVEARGRTRWMGAGQGLSFAMARMIREILTATVVEDHWSRRASERIAEQRQAFSWLDANGSVVLQAGANGIEWWTHAGQNANRCLEQALSEDLGVDMKHGSFALYFPHGVTMEAATAAITKLRKRNADSLMPLIDENAIEGLKFSECLPMELATRMLQRRLQDRPAVKHVLTEDVRFIAMQE